ADRARGGPTSANRVVSAAGIQTLRAITATPDDHFAASPNCRVKPSCNGRVGSARRYPTVGGGIVPAASVEEMVAKIKKRPTPDKSSHFQSTLRCDPSARRAHLQ